MGIKIDDKREADLYPSILARLLPSGLLDELYSLEREVRVEEIRLRENSCVTLTTCRGNVFLRTRLTQREIGEIFEAMCDYSLYAHAQTINSGYITLCGGIRVGVCGRAVTNGGSIVGVYDISALNIRLPSPQLSVGGHICDMVLSSGGRGVLIYSSPGVGKTTLLRSVAFRLSCGEHPKRVVVIDTRGELGILRRDSRATIDILSGYPLKVGIEIASRTMNAQLMVCDEIGNSEECESIVEAQNCGVPLLASAHGNDIIGLLSRSGIARLHAAGVFAHYVKIERASAGRDYKYSEHSAKEANDILKACGMCAHNL